MRRRPALLALGLVLAALGAAHGQHRADYDREALLGGQEEAEEYARLSPEEQQRRLRAIVRKIDSDGDGLLSKEELSSWIQQSFKHYVTQEAKQHFNDYDKDGDGLVSWKEYNLQMYDRVIDFDENTVLEDQEEESFRQVFLIADFFNIYCKEQTRQHCPSAVCQPSSALSLPFEINDPALIKMEESDCGTDLELASSKHVNLPEGGSLVHQFSKEHWKIDFSLNSSSCSPVLSVVRPSESPSSLNSRLSALTKLFSKLHLKEKKRFEKANRDDVPELNVDEFVAFEHPEEAEYMTDFVIQEGLEEHDKDGDGFVSLEEFLGDYRRDPTAREDPEWILVEKDRFVNDYDKDNDGKLNPQELLSWIVPNNQGIAQEEALHLIEEMDLNDDKKLSEAEILKNQDLFLNSEATDYGRQLHDERFYHEEL